MSERALRPFPKSSADIPGRPTSRFTYLARFSFSLLNLDGLSSATFDKYHLSNAVYSDPGALRA